MLYPLNAVERASWLFTEQGLQVDGLEMEEAITIACGLVDIATAGRFRPRDVVCPSRPPARVRRVISLFLGTRLRDGRRSRMSSGDGCPAMPE
jgi:hypothetical protein